MAAAGGNAVAEALTHLRHDLQQALTKASTGLAALATTTTTTATNAAAISKSHSLSFLTRHRPEDHSSGGLPPTPPGVCTPPEGRVGEVESFIPHQGVSSPDYFPSKNEQGNSSVLSSLFPPLYPSTASSKQKGQNTSFAEDLSSRSTELPPLSELERQPAETVDCRIEKSHTLSVQTSGLSSHNGEGEEQAREPRAEKSNEELKGGASGAKSVFSLSPTTGAVDPTYVREGGGGGKNIDEEAEERSLAKSGEEKKIPEKDRRRYFFHSPDNRVLQRGGEKSFYHSQRDQGLHYLPKTSSSFSSYSLDTHAKNPPLSSSFLPSPSPSSRVSKKEKLSSSQEALSTSQRDLSLTRKRIGTSTGCCSLVSSPCSPALRLASFSSSPSLASSTGEKHQGRTSQKDEDLFKREKEKKEEENRTLNKYIWGRASTSRLDEAENAWFIVDLLRGNSESGGSLEKAMDDLPGKPSFSSSPPLLSSSSVSPNIPLSPSSSAYIKTQGGLLLDKVKKGETTYTLPLASERRRREEEVEGQGRIEEEEEETLHFSSSYQDFLSFEKMKRQKEEDKKLPDVLPRPGDPNIVRGRERGSRGDEEQDVAREGRSKEEEQPTEGKEGREMNDLLSKVDVLCSGLREDGNVYMRKELTLEHRRAEESIQLEVNEAEKREERSLDQQRDQPGDPHNGARREQGEGEEREEEEERASSSSEFIDLSSSLPPSLIASTVMSECLADSLSSLESRVSTTRGGEEEEDLSSSLSYGKELRKEEEGDSNAISSASVLLPQGRHESGWKMDGKAFFGGEDSNRLIEEEKEGIVGGRESSAKRCDEENALGGKRTGEEEGEKKENLASSVVLSQARHGHSKSEETSFIQEHVSSDSEDNDKSSSSASPLSPAGPFSSEGEKSFLSSSSLVGLSSSSCVPLCSVDEVERKQRSFTRPPQHASISSSSSSLHTPLLETPPPSCTSLTSPILPEVLESGGHAPPGDMNSLSQPSNSYRNSRSSRSILPVSFFPALTSLTFSPSFLFKKKSSVDLDEDLEVSSHSRSLTEGEGRRGGRTDRREDERPGDALAVPSNAYRGVREGNSRRIRRGGGGGERRHHMRKTEGSTSFAMMDFVRNSIALYGQSALEGVVFLVPAEDAEELVVALEESIPYSWRDVEHAALEALKPLTAVVVGRLVLVELPAMVAEVFSIGASTESAAAAATTATTIEASGVLSTALSLAPWLIVLGGCVYAIVRSAKALQASRRSHLFIETIESLPNEERRERDWNISQGRRGGEGEGRRRGRSPSNEGRREEEQEERRAISRYDSGDFKTAVEERRTRDERRRRGRDRREVSLERIDVDGYRRIPADLLVENEEEEARRCKKENLEGTAWREDHSFLTGNEGELCSIQWRGGGGDPILLPPLEV
ncbi:hypothetical protein CSUI_009690 [Cystoisospora suis]|uniref:Uncharacterized protein n=1 Tax=Cystoisospora suis TaxID=483139 RepID=A0A2C6KJA3_9APIC|nr:hypothetical protein CSUI_009690 [Cystoisospora suis]